MANCVDLTLLARTVDNARWAGKYNASLGLARLIEAYEYRLLTKDATRSNWEAKLNAVQIECQPFRPLLFLSSIFSRGILSHSDLIPEQTHATMPMQGSSSIRNWPSSRR